MTKHFLSRFLSRVLIVVVWRLIECLAAVLRFLHIKPHILPHAASIG